MGKISAGPHANRERTVLIHFVVFPVLLFLSVLAHDYEETFFFFWSHSSALRVVLSNIGVVSLLCSAGKLQSLTNSSETTIN